jgi:hypothetical protein
MTGFKKMILKFSLFRNCTSSAALALLFVVGLLACGELFKQGGYHLDGGRGWDLPKSSQLDSSHNHLRQPAPYQPAKQAQVEAFYPEFQFYDLPLFSHQPFLAYPAMWLRPPPFSNYLPARVLSPSGLFTPTI